jgi:hypothetical protein
MAIWQAGGKNMESLLKTTLRLDKELLRQTKKFALEKDKTLGQVIEESLGLFLKNQGVSAKTSSKHFYRWAESLSKKKGFSHLKEADVVRLVRESRSL